jgi:hypothetical protein
MYDTTIHAKTLARRLQASDFVADPMLFGAPYRQSLIDQATAIGSFGFPALALTTSQLRGKNVYQLVDLASLLVIRHLTSNIRRITGVKQDNRQFIVECIRILMESGVPFRLYKFDIKNFYESVLVEDILDRLAGDVAFSGQSARALESFFQRLQSSGVVGLPRGLAISATLSEYLLRRFDDDISNASGVWYYSRFVDDIIVVAKRDLHPVKFTEFATTALPIGLRFNAKSSTLDFPAVKKGNTADSEGKFSFLGYTFDVSKAFRNPSDRRVSRIVNVDMAPSKIRRLKTRLVNSVIQYNRDGIYADLLDRVRLLTSNFRFVDYKTGTRRTSGIYFNYPLIDPATATSFTELDKFFRNLIMSPHPKNALRPHLPPQRRRELVRLTFRSGFERKRFFHFRTERIAQLRSCWAYA